ncbi:hypothetical protein [Streptomyces sp. NPDC005303]|uniref:DUF3885 domain-containing protein n=1 Tax=Streptomyces sp. NPDC005303 TaxID=3155713 RepID=UPI0033B2871D
MTSAVDPEHLSALWRRRWSQGPPVAHELRTRHPERWVRVHSLPGSKRYPVTEEEYAVVLERYNAVLGELFGGGEVYVVTVGWSWERGGREPAERRREVHPEGVRWLTLVDEDDHGRAETYTHLYADRRPWRRGCVDPILREVADDVLAGVFVTDVGMRRIHHPYDGGADVLLTSPEERERLRGRFTEWLSPNASGL